MNVAREHENTMKGDRASVHRAFIFGS